MTQSTVITALQNELVNPKGTQEVKNTCNLAACRLQSLPTVSPKEAQEVKNTGNWPQTAEMHPKGMISLRPDSCIFPNTEMH